MKQFLVVMLNSKSNKQITKTAQAGQPATKDKSRETGQSLDTLTETEEQTHK